MLTNLAGKIRDYLVSQKNWMKASIVYILLSACSCELRIYDVPSDNWERSKWAQKNMDVYQHAYNISNYPIL